MSLTLNEAETIAFQAVAFVAANEEAMAGLLRLTGASLADLKAAIERPEVLAAFLQFLLQNEARLIEFCQAAGLDPMAPSLALGAIEQHISS
ncbi:MAG: DUF3572 domain-containing protein [Proteobacteria bacterium]|jgi:hypothetical protein|nr:MAG: DUF3572 domain-containing protein [Pseudomonadota bacterium]